MSKRTGILAAVTALAVALPASAALAAGGGGTGADLQISGSSSTGSPDPGAAYNYNFQVKNSGPQAATSVTFTDPLPAGVVFTGAGANGSVSACSTSSDASGATVVSCNLGTILSGGSASVVVSATAPGVAGTYSNTASVASADVADPNTSNNSVTVNVQVKVPVCTLPAGQTTLYGLVMLKYTDANGMFNNFQLQVNGVDYTVLTNFYDGSQPLTSVINLSCKTSPAQFIQVGNFVYVTGTVDDVNKTINASVVQVLTFKDKA